MNKKNAHKLSKKKKKSCGKCTPCTMPELGLPCTELQKRRDKSRKKKLKALKSAEYRALQEQQQEEENVKVEQKKLISTGSTKNNISLETKSAECIQGTSTNKRFAEQFVQKTSQASVLQQDVERQRSTILSSRDSLASMLASVGLLDDTIGTFFSSIHY